MMHSFGHLLQAPSYHQPASVREKGYVGLVVEKRLVHLRSSIPLALPPHDRLSHFLKMVEVPYDSCGLRHSITCLSPSKHRTLSSCSSQSLRVHGGAVDAFTR